MKCLRLLILCMLLGVFLCTGCGEKPKVDLTVWASEAECEFVQKQIDEFCEKNREEADFEISLQKEDVLGAKKLLLEQADHAGDVFLFADDQYADLLHAKALLALPNQDKIMANYGGKEAPIIQAAMSEGKLYGYPVTSGNGYFLYYNKKYFEEGDLQSLDNLMDKAHKQGGFVGMDWTSGWYLYSFFQGAGMDVRLRDDGSVNQCDFNRKKGEYTGVDVAKAMLRISKNKGFKSVVSDDFILKVKDGSMLAFVSGTWNAAELEQIWGEDLGAIKLPTYTIKGKQVQMGSFVGYKFIGINAKTKQAEWATKLGEWLSSKENQLKRYQMTGECPADPSTQQMDEVKKSVAVAAQTEQAKYAKTQKIGSNYWNAMSVYGIFMASGNVDVIDLQVLLDDAVKEITAKEKSDKGE